MNPNRLTQLRQTLERHFNDQELRTLCFDLGLDYDSLGGAGKGDKARELVAYLERHSRLAELIELGRQQRPDVDWGAAPAAVPGTGSGPAAPQKSGESISLTISDATVSGQVAVGQGISQSQTVGAGPASAAGADVPRLSQALAQLKARVQAQAGPAERESAGAKVAELERAAAAPEVGQLDLATLETVRLWFAKHLPGLADDVMRVITHPVLAKRFLAAGDSLAAEYQRRFGKE